MSASSLHRESTDSLILVICMAPSGCVVNGSSAIIGSLLSYYLCRLLLSPVEGWGHCSIHTLWPLCEEPVSIMILQK